MEDNISVNDLDRLIAAFEEMEGEQISLDGVNTQVPWGTGGCSLDQALRAYNEYHSIEPPLSEEEMDEIVKEYNPIMGEAIYGDGGWRRYFLRYDGYVYFSEYHSREPYIQKAKDLGFRMN